MKKAFFFLIVFLLFIQNIMASNLKGDIKIDYHHFFHTGYLPEQKTSYYSSAVQLDYYFQVSDKGSIALKPFARIDNLMSNKSRMDIRELTLNWYEDTWELQCGVGKLFWGAADYVNLVDIINQIDVLESIFGYEKLGQPMIRYSANSFFDGNIEIVIMPFFRELDFPDRKNRFVANMEIGPPEYEQGNKRSLDFASRYALSFGELDIGLSFFNGTSRIPLLLIDNNTPEKLTPFYAKINQIGLDLTWIFSGCLFKLESIKSSSKKETYYAYVGGIEYSFFNLWNSGMDLGVIFERTFNNHELLSTRFYDNDIVSSLRLAFNDWDNLEIFISIINRVNSMAQIIRFESRKRISSNLRFIIEAVTFSNLKQNELYGYLNNEDFIMSRFIYYF